MTLSFPDAIATGIAYKHFDLVPRDFVSVTDSYTFEDEGKDFNRRSSNPPRVWNIEPKGHLTKTQTDIFDAFWESVGIDVPFNFTDKYGDTWPEVRVKSYSRDHQDHQAWNRKVKFMLIQYKALDPVDLTAPTVPTGGGGVVMGPTSILITLGDSTDPTTGSGIIEGGDCEGDVIT